MAGMAGGRQIPLGVKPANAGREPAAGSPLLTRGPSTDNIDRGVRASSAGRDGAAVGPTTSYTYQLSLACHKDSEREAEKA